MSALTQVRAGVVLAAEFGQAAYTALTGGRRLRLLTATGDQASAGTEITAGGNYAAGGSAITFGAPVAQTGTYSSRISNNAWSTTNMPAVGGGGVVGIDIRDEAGTPVRVAFGALTAAKTVASGDTLSFPAGSITVDL